MFADAIATLLSRHCTPAVVRAIEAGASPRPLAAAIAEAGFHELLAPEAQGGAAAPWDEFFDVVRLCGARAVPLPLPQTLAARALVPPGQALPEGLLTFSPHLVRAADGALHAAHVPFARTADHVLGVLDDGIVLLPVAGARMQPSGVHRSLAASLQWPGAAAQVLAGADAALLGPLGALLHAGLLAGALERVFELTMAHANDRVQFGKPIGKFQAVQHQLAVMAEQVAMARTAAQRGFGRGHTLPSWAACAVAKARTSEAAQTIASIAHAVHGAMGITEEHDLQLHTRRLHEWRIAHGSESYWHRELGRRFLDSPLPLAADFARSLC